MSQFGRKLIIWILLVIIGLGGISLLVNNQFVERYYLKIKKQELQYAYEQVVETSPEHLQEVMDTINGKESLWVIQLPWEEDQDKLNEQIITGLDTQGIRIKKLWLWETDSERLASGEVVNQIYNQGKLGYSVLIKFFKMNENLMMICSIVPHVTSIIEIINVFSMIVWLGSVLLMSVVILLFISKITKPLMEIKQVADGIANLQFNQIHVRTGDELESVAESINRMSERLQQNHEQLAYQNAAMKRLLSDVSHELKTPIALIKAYGTGIEDGLDDGTFLETIMSQNSLMEQMVEKLLGLSRLESQSVRKESVRVDWMLREILDEQQIYMKQQHIKLYTEIEEDVVACIEEEALRSIVTNLITNAIKYTQNHQIHIRLEKRQGLACFAIRNGVQEGMVEHLTHIWEPFYVGDQSRNKNLSGTGLGLYIVHRLLEKYGMPHECYIEGQEIVFTMALKLDLQHL